MSKYKALMLDLDGTTLPNHADGMPSPRVAEAIRKAQKNLAVCIVTGRLLYEAEPVLDTLAITTPVVLMGGSQIIDATSREFIYKKPLERQDYSKVIESLRTFDVNLSVREENQYVPITDRYEPVTPYAISVNNVKDAVADTIIKEISHIPTVAVHKILSWSAGYYVLNISHAMATKQHGIYEVAKMLKIETHEMIGIGDGPNDFPLLMACGLKIAMGNAVPDLKEIADYVAPTIDEDGVADVIEKFVLTG